MRMHTFKPDAIDSLLAFVKKLDALHQPYQVQFDGRCYVVEISSEMIAPMKEVPIESRPSYLDRIIVITKDGIGSEGTALSKALMQTYLRATAEQAPYPKAILFMHRGVFLALGESPALDALRSLESKGVLILSNCSCLEYHKVMDQLSVGGITNMYHIVELMGQAKSVVTL